MSRESSSLQYKQYLSYKIKESQLDIFSHRPQFTITFNPNFAKLKLEIVFN